MKKAFVFIVIIVFVILSWRIVYPGKSSPTSSATIKLPTTTPSDLLTVQDQVNVLKTTTIFISAWLTPDPNTRAHALESVASSDLAEKLRQTIKVWGSIPSGPPSIIRHTTTTAVTHQLFSDGRAIQILLILDPNAPHQWVVVDIAPISS